MVVKGTPRRTYREITAIDARGQITGETLGGGVVRTRRSHDVKTGRITGITTTDALMRTAQADTYGWDVLGNLTARTGVVGDNTLAETYEYDTLNRLTEAKADHTHFNPETRTTTTQTLTPQTVTYDALGNITRKSDVGTYSYHAAHPYAVDKTEVKDQDNNTTSTYYNYDALGNQVSGAGRSLGYTSFNKVKRISRGTATQVYFTYGPARSRLTRTDITNTGNGRTTTTTVYLGNVEHVIAEDGSSTWKRYLANGAVLITQDHDTLDTRTAETTHYLLKDHLGSLTALLCQCQCKTPHLCQTKIPQFVEGGRSLRLAECDTTEDPLRLVSTDGGYQGDYLGEIVYASRTACTRCVHQRHCPPDGTGPQNGQTSPGGGDRTADVRTESAARLAAGSLHGVS